MNKPLYVLLLLITLCNAYAFGQKTVSVSVTAAPVFASTSYVRRYFYPNSNGQVVEPIFINGRRWSTGYSAGVMVHYTYAPGWSVASGVWYGQLSVRQERLPIMGEGASTVSSRAVRVPLLINYRSSTKRLSPYFSLGVLVDFPFTSRVVVARANEPTQRLRLDTGKGPVFQPLLSAGVDYQINSRYALSVQPTWTYNMGRFGGSATYNPSFELSLLTQLVYKL
ncbi:outer membrane beta-barrel protein [Spirosoma fluminis]